MGHLQVVRPAASEVLMEALGRGHSEAHPSEDRRKASEVLMEA